MNIVFDDGIKNIIKILIGGNMKDLSFLKQSLIAHRGLHDNINVPENSIKAFELAIKYKNIIELDVHLLKDDTLVVFHDFNLKRMTGISEKIEKYSYDELKKVKLLDTNYIIPTLKDVLNIVNGKVPILLEVKSDNKSTKINKEIVKLMDNYNGKYAIQSFNPYVVLWFKRNKKDYITGLLMGNKAKTFSESLIRSKIIFYVPK